MAEISIITTQNNGGWMCIVQVTEPNGQTRHSVTVSRAHYQQLTDGKETTPDLLVKRSFEFLLERESKNLILRQFELPVISRFFPEYAAEIKKRL